MKNHNSESSGKGVNTIKRKYGESAFIMNSESFSVSLPFNEFVLEPRDAQNDAQNDAQDLNLSLEDKIITQIKSIL